MPEFCSQVIFSMDARAEGSYYDRPAAVPFPCTEVYFTRFHEIPTAFCPHCRGMRGLADLLRYLADW